MKRLAALTTTVLSLAAAGAIAVWLIIPTFRSITALRAATIAEHEQLEHRSQRLRARSRAVRDLVEAERALRELRSRVPSDRNALEFVRTIEGIAATRRLEERIAIAWDAAPAVGRYRTDVPTTIELTGAYPDLIAAVRDLERLPLPPAVQRLTISSVRQAVITPQREHPRIQLVLEARTTWRTEPQP